MSHTQEVKQRIRFEFGQNWKRFLKVVDEGRIDEAQKAIRVMLGIEDLSDRTFLDIGSGSGLSSLAARRMGAIVHSFDYDPNSVCCTRELKRKFLDKDDYWKIEEGNVLDSLYMNALDTYDIVYSWGVLHHTGNMWQALEHAVARVAPDGILFIAIYNDQGRTSRRWRIIKKTYLSSLIGKIAVCSFYIPYWIGAGFILDLSMGKNPVRRYVDYRRMRGMSIVHDWLDWLGGYPFEVATPESIIDFCHDRGFVLRKLKTTQGLGCNQYVFVKNE